MEAEIFEQRMLAQGWALFPGVVPARELERLRRDVLASVADCGRRQVDGRVGEAPDGTAHHAVGQYDSFDEFLDHGWLEEHIDGFFGGAPFILHAFNPATVAPACSSYLHRIHRDVRTHAGGFRMLVNMLVMVDAFSLENGATYVLSGSHHEAEAPDEARFWREADRLVGPAGSIVLFDSNLWHAAGANQSNAPRAALTLSYSRAFIKQQMDYPRFLGPAYGQALSPRMRQRLGYNAMVPCTYEEWYRPRAERLYQADQG